MRQSEAEYKKITRRQKIPLTPRIIRNISYVPTNPHGEYKKNPPRYNQGNPKKPREAIFDMHKIYELDRQMKYILKDCKNSQNPKQNAGYVWSMYKGIIRTILNRIHELFISQQTFYKTHENNLKYLIANPNPIERQRRKRRDIKKWFDSTIKYGFKSHLEEIQKLCRFVSKNTIYYKSCMLTSMKNGMEKSKKIRLTEQRKILKYMSIYFNNIHTLADYVYKRTSLILKYYYAYEKDNMNLSKYMIFKQKSYIIMSPLLEKINIQRSTHKNYENIYSKSNQKLII